MKYTILKTALFLFVLALVVAMFSGCNKKASKKRSAVYTCYTAHMWGGDTILENPIVFEYWNGTCQQLEDHLNSQVVTPLAWAECY